jgi:hypothetical protein
MSQNRMVPLILSFLFIPLFIYAFPTGSPSWGFFIDLPEEYELVNTDGASSFIFQSETGASVYIKAYDAGKYDSVEAVADSVQKQLKNQGETETFDYRGKKAVILELSFPNGPEQAFGYGLCLELDGKEAKTAGGFSGGGVFPGAAQGNSPASKGKLSAGKPFLVVLAYSGVQSDELTIVHLSALDSVSPSLADKHGPGPITEYTYPRGEAKNLALAGGLGQAVFRENDAEAAQYLVDREYMVLERYADHPRWKEAWERYYRMIYRDSFERLQNAAFILERAWNVPALTNRDLANAVLKWTQEFVYERSPEGSDFVNLVSAATEGRGDCDSRALLFALILEQADIPATMMVSKEFSHAMGLVDVEGEGARFLMESKELLVAETTAHVDIGLINESISETVKWFGVKLE